jgi:hypothetical protein
MPMIVRSQLYGCLHDFIPATRGRMRSHGTVAFMQALRNDVGKSTKFSIIPLLCEGQPCAVRGSEPTILMAAARNAGAKLLLYGGIHKQSTLIQWAKVEVIDLERERLVYNRLLSFRGDDANAWRRAEQHLAKDLETLDLTR